MKIRDRQENDPTPTPFNWIAQVARMVGGARFVQGRRVRDNKAHIDVHVEDFVVECTVQDDKPEDVAIAVAAEISRRRGRPRSCPTWQDHDWEEQPDGMFHCTKCTFKKSRGDLMLADKFIKEDK